MQRITVQTTINASIASVWDAWTSPESIQQWNFASEAWHCPQAINTLEVGKGFSYTMAAKDDSMAFDLIGVYSVIEPEKHLAYTLEDDRAVDVYFSQEGESVEVIQRFESEDENSIAMQKQGWQAILNNFKRFVESSN